MPIIKSKPKCEKEQVKLSIDRPLMDQIKSYCEWAGLEKMEEFFEEAAKFVFSKDKGWKKAMDDVKS